MKDHPYASRGGVKLEHALREFKVEVKDKIVLDVGSSTGGFTDCLLQNGARQVYAVDVGYGLLAWKLRKDPRVKVVERTNIRYLKLEDLGLKTPEIEISTIDVSFISLSKVLPTVYNLLVEKGQVIALIKPQFEARREQVGRGGIVRDERVHNEVIEKVKKAAQSMGFTVAGVTASPITGAEGNIEFFVYLIK
jgi:23S rRNA (cytidine1920-2'-O)/16S rRNA (cytidine1409-2'-O)-methyltransferase